jgi:hypothetical protein
MIYVIQKIQDYLNNTFTFTTTKCIHVRQVI